MRNFFILVVLLTISLGLLVVAHIILQPPLWGTVLVGISLFLIFSFAIVVTFDWGQAAEQVEQENEQAQ